MKPSQRIKEILVDKYGRDALGLSDAIMDFLDEEQEKNQPCKHTDSYQVESQLGDVYYNVCNDCGVLFLASKD